MGVLRLLTLALPRGLNELLMHRKGSAQSGTLQVCIQEMLVAIIRLRMIIYLESF